MGEMRFCYVCYEWLKHNAVQHYYRQIFFRSNRLMAAMKHIAEHKYFMEFIKTNASLWLLVFSILSATVLAVRVCDEENGKDMSRKRKIGCRCRRERRRRQSSCLLRAQYAN